MAVSIVVLIMMNRIACINNSTEQIEMSHLEIKTTLAFLNTLAYNKYENKTL